MSSTVYSHGIAIPKVEDVKSIFKSRMIILFGQSGSGKSSVLIHIMNCLRDVIPLAIVACPTASLNGDYNNIVPDQCIYDDVSKPLMQKIFQRQTNVIAMHDIVHDATHLSPIFRLVADQASSIKINQLTQIFNKGVSDIKRSYDEEDIENAVDELTAKFNKKRVKIMRSCINKNMERFQSEMHKLTDMQKSILSNFNINPLLLLLIDDCMASIKEWKDLEETRKLFYQGRHYGVTCIISAQSIVSIPPPFRANAHILIFTTQTAANNYVNKASSGMSNEDKKMISRIAETVFAPSQDRNRPNFKKLVIYGQIIKTDNVVQYIIGTPKKKKFGSVALWTLCENVKKQQHSSLNSNSFSKMFALKQSPTLDHHS